MSCTLSHLGGTAFCRSLVFILVSSLWLWSAYGLEPTNPPVIGRGPLELPLHRRSSSARTKEEWGDWAKAHKEHLEMKYGGGEGMSKRERGANLLVNQNSDSSFFGSLAIGTPPVSYFVILDTGSADLWVADGNCTGTTCSNVPTFDPSASSTFVTANTPFNIKYGSGSASGTLGGDTVQMAGFSVVNQTFALVNTVSSGLLTSPVSGLLGLGWKSISSAGTMPFWQALARERAWDAPVMGFHLTRFVNISRAGTLEPGGSFTMGYVDDSLYTGDIEYQDLAATPSYWILPLSSLSVRGNTISTPTGSQANSAIDTGTTLVGGPPRAIEALYQQIPGAAPGSGNFRGYYTYPCNQNANVTVSFGGRSWPISEADFRLTKLTEAQCLGAFFELTTGRSAPTWIFGDTFLKNVYSVFRYNPPSVGFAQLSDKALARNGVSGPIPSPTIGSPATTVTGGGPTTPLNSAPKPMPLAANLALCVWAVGMFVGLLVV